MSASYVLTASAEADLRNIVRYTRKEWGDRQVRAYTTKLAKAAERLAVGEGAMRILSDIHPNLRVARCEHHYIFCLVRNNAPSIIIAIFHEKMDLLERLSDRLRA